MYTISQFSKLCGLTVKALRYYDTEGMLKPSFRKAENQYRYYSDEDLKTAQMIQYLRSLEFTIMEIKDILNNIENLYRVSSEREVSKIQDEFLRVFKTKDLRQLERFHRQLDIIAEGYRAQAVHHSI